MPSPLTEVRRALLQESTTLLYHRVSRLGFVLPVLPRLDDCTQEDLLLLREELSVLLDLLEN